MNKLFLFLLITLGLTHGLYAQDAKQQLKSKLDAAVVYTVGVEMQHSASATLKKGNNELTISNISTYLDENSIQIKAPGTVTVLSVEFTNRYLLPADKPLKVRQLEDSIVDMQRELDRIDLKIRNNKSSQQVLDDNKNIKGAQSGLSMDELTKLVDYYKNKSYELQHDILQLTEKRKKIEEQISLSKKKVQEELASQAISGGRLIVKLSSALAGNADISFSYISPNAFWIPVYDVKVNNLKDPLQLAFKAKVSQNTGIDWKQVRLSLSSSLPSQYGEAPILKQWFLHYISTYYLDRKQKELMSNQIQSYEIAEDVAPMKMTVSEESSVGYFDGRNSNGKGLNPVYVVNGEVMTSSRYSEIDQSLVKSSTFIDANTAVATYGQIAGGGAYIITLKTDIEDYVNISENALNLVFDIDLPYDIPSNGESQTIHILNKDVKALYKHYSVPKLDPESYLLAEIPNWNSLNLLQGEASIIFENTYVGKTYINPASTNDTLNLTMGKDKRVSVKRLKLEDFSSSKFISSNKVQKFTYEITVKNNKNEIVHYMLKDQYPLSSMKEIEVELLESGEAVINKELGVLTWRMDLAPGESKKVRFAYSIKYPKDKVLNIN